MDKTTYDRFRHLLLGLPAWPKERDRDVFVRDALFGHRLLDHYRSEGDGYNAASELLTLCLRFDSPTEGGVTPLCALLAEIHERGWAGSERAETVAGVGPHANPQFTAPFG